jgi:ribosomal protein S18 acetylase RimI-like enzyme
MNELLIRPYQPEDEHEVIDLWYACGLVVPWNNPKRDIERKMKLNPELFLVGTLEGKVVATCMAGYEGHRGWVNYLAVSPDYQRRGVATRMMQEAEIKLRERGCPKINVQIRLSNQEVINFYESIGFSDDRVLGMGKRLERDEPYDRS